MSAKQALRLANGVLQRTPFLHAVFPDCIDPLLAESLLMWFETDAQWQWASVDDFYDQFDLDLQAGSLPQDLRVLIDNLFLEELRQEIGTLVEAPLDERVDVSAHKMLSGCHVGIHTDYRPAAQAYRLLVHLNRGWKPTDGGLLMLFSEKDPSADSESTKCYAPQHGRAIVFEISPTSFHAVSQICLGARYALRFSFYSKSKVQT